MLLLGKSSFNMSSDRPLFEIDVVCCLEVFPLSLMSSAAEKADGDPWWCTHTVTIRAFIHSADRFSAIDASEHSVLHWRRGAHSILCSKLLHTENQARLCYLRYRKYGNVHFWLKMEQDATMSVQKFCSISLLHCE